MEKKITGKLLLSAFVALTLFSSTACSNPEEEKEASYKKALEYIKKNNADAAILELKNALQIDPKFGAARYELGKLYLDTGAPTKAYEEYVRAADLDPENIDANLKAAQFYMVTQNKDSSRKYADQVLKVAPDNIEALILLANIELIEGNSEKAMEIVDSLGAKVETSARLLNLKGRIFATQKRWEDAEKVFKQAITVSKEKKASHYMMLLRLYRQQKETEKVENLLEQMEKALPDDPQVYMLNAEYYQSKRQFDKVESLLRKVIELTPDSPMPMFQLIAYKEQRGDITGALALAEEAQAKFPEDDGVKVRVASLLFEQRKFDQAKEILDSIKAENTNMPSAQLLAARFLVNEKKYQDANDSFQAIIKEYPKWDAPYYYLGLSHFSRGNIQQTEIALAKALELNKSNSAYFALMARIQLAKGNFAESRKNALAALRLNPQNIRAAEVLGKALIGMKEYTQAVSVLTQILNVTPEDKTILESLAIASLGSKDKENGEKYLNKLLAVDPGHSRGLALHMGLKYPDNIEGATLFIRKQLKKVPEDVRVLFILGNMLYSQGDTDEALHYLELARKQQPDNAQVYLAIARIYAAAGEREKALEQYQAILSRQPKSIPALMGIADLEELDGNSVKAAEYYNKILEIAPNNALAANNLAWIIAEEDDGDLGRALQLSMIAKQEQPDSIQIIDTLGWVHFKRKAYALAIGQFEFALEKAPGNPMLLYHLALAYDAQGEKEMAQKTLQKIDMTKAFPYKKDVEELKAKLLP